MHLISPSPNCKRRTENAIQAIASDVSKLGDIDINDCCSVMPKANAANEVSF